MQRVLSRLCGLLSATILAGCTTIPPFVLGDDGLPASPAGPKVADLMVNLKCELWNAAHSKERLPHYRDSEPLRDRFYEKTEAQQNSVPLDRLFTLENIFNEIEYVAQADFTLDAFQTGSTSPTASYTNPFNGAAANIVLAVGGQLSEQAHRQMKISTSVDFSRLVKHQLDPSDPRRTLATDPTPCQHGAELRGVLGLKETLAAGLIASAMNDVAIFPTSSDKGEQISGASSPIPTGEAYPFGEITATIDFTITEDVNGGFVLNLHRFVGNASPLFDANRKVIDAVAITFIPICVRHPFVTADKAPPYRYTPELAEGTPGWANYIPPCGTIDRMAQKASAAAGAKQQNEISLLQNALQSFVRR